MKKLVEIEKKDIEELTEKLRRIENPGDRLFNALEVEDRIMDDIDDKKNERRELTAKINVHIRKRRKQYTEVRRILNQARREVTNKVKNGERVEFKDLYDY